MKSRLSLLQITKNAEELLEKSLNSTKGLVDEIIIVDDSSTDHTLDIATKLKARIYTHNEPDFSKQRAYGLKMITSEWVLVLDSDEIVSEELRSEIAKLLNGYIAKKNGYLIPFQNHFLGKPLNHGGEDYKKLVLFKKAAVKIEPALVHEQFKVISGSVGSLKNKIYHYSYRSLRQMYKKFTDYALREAKQKIKKGEKTSFKKIFFYPPHMFWARFIKDKGYKDGIFRIPLDLGFAYMEFLTYFMMLFIKKNSKLKTQMSKPQLKT